MKLRLNPSRRWGYLIGPPLLGWFCTSPPSSPCCTTMMSAAAASLMIRQRHRYFRRFLSSMAAQIRDTQSTGNARGEKLPLLMVYSSPASSPASRSLYKLTKDDTSHISNLERHHHDLTLPPGIIPYDDYRLAGSSRGFLFFSPKSGGGEIQAINPVTGAHFRLPPVPDRPDFTYVSSYGPGPFRMKVILSPSLDMAVLLPENTRSSNAEFVRLPSSHWTPFSVSPHIDFIQDCAFHKNRLYVVDLYHRVAAFDEDVLPSSNLSPSATWAYDKLPVSADLRCIDFVESPDGDDIFLAFRCASPRGGLPDNTLRWWVYRCGDDSRGWKPVESIGDSALFMGAYGGMFLPVPRHGSCVLERDCVYFSDCPSPRRSIQKGLVDTGMYHLEDGTVEFLTVTDNIKIRDYSPPVWLPSPAC